VCNGKYQVACILQELLEKMPENYIQIGMTKFDYVIGSKFNAAARTTRVAPQFLTKHIIIR